MRNSSTRSTPVLVLGNGLTVLGVLRCLGRRNVPVYCLSGDLGFEARSRWCRSTEHGMGAFASAGELERVLESLPVDRAVLVACSDHWTVETPRISASLKERFRACSPESDVLRQFVDKGRFARLLESAGVPHPFTVVAETREDVVEAAARSGGGLFLKPTESERFHRKFGKKAFRIDDPARAIEIFEEAREAGLGVMVQEYIPGRSDRHYFIDGFVDRSHRLHAFFARRRLRMYPPDFGNSSYMISIGPETVADAVETLRTLAGTTGYRGILSAEFKLDERDGRFKILEVNCRPWWYIQFAAECGVNVVEMAYRDALEMPLPRCGEYRVGARLVFPRYDRHALFEMRRRGEPILKELARSWIGASNPVFSWDDPMPAVAEVLGWVSGKLASR